MTCENEVINFAWLEIVLFCRKTALQLKIADF